jgi:hypothetical protein
VIILDPVNMPLIKDAVANGTRDFIGGNCTVSLMLMGMAGLFQRDEIEWMTSMTYQAARGAARQHARAGCADGAVGDDASPCWIPRSAILDIDRAVTNRSARALPREISAIRSPQPAALVDKDMGTARAARWKGTRTNKILGAQRQAFPWTASVCAFARCAATAGAPIQSCAAAADLRDRAFGNAMTGWKVVPTAGRDAGRAHPGCGHRQAFGPGRAACARCRWAGLPGGLHGRRPAALGAAEPLRRMVRSFWTPGEAVRIKKVSRFAGLSH